MEHFDGVSTGTTESHYNGADQLDLSCGPDDAVSDDIAYEYDSNGNMSAALDQAMYSGKLYQHNRENRLVAVVDHQDGKGDSVLVSYGYDAFGRRITRTASDGTITRYYYAGLSTLLTKEKPAGGAWRTKQIYALKQDSVRQVIAERSHTMWNALQQAIAWDDNWFQFDLGGNVVAITASDGAARSIHDMTAFGNVIEGERSGFHLGTKEYDVDANLYYFNARWYDCARGLFLSKTVMSPQQEQGYAFCNGSPTMRVDPTGLCYAPFPLPGGEQRPGLEGTVCALTVARAFQESFLNDVNWDTKDTYMHCVVACNIRQQCGGVPIGFWEYNIFREKVTDVPESGRPNGLGDLQADADGLECGKCKTGSCDDCCEKTMGY